MAPWRRQRPRTGPAARPSPAGARSGRRPARAAAVAAAPPRPAARGSRPPGSATGGAGRPAPGAPGGRVPAAEASRAHGSGARQAAMPPGGGRPGPARRRQRPPSRGGSSPPSVMGPAWWAALRSWSGAAAGRRPGSPATRAAPVSTPPPHRRSPAAHRSWAAGRPAPAAPPAPPGSGRLPRRSRRFRVTAARVLPRAGRARRLPDAVVAPDGPAAGRAAPEWRSGCRTGNASPRPGWGFPAASRWDTRTPGGGSRRSRPRKGRDRRPSRAMRRADQVRACQGRAGRGRVPRERASRRGACPGSARPAGPPRRALRARRRDGRSRDPPGGPCSWDRQSARPTTSST
jgi:translation initiation factor IF-2